jgi:hypothetical protein
MKKLPKPQTFSEFKTVIQIMQINFIHVISKNVFFYLSIKSKVVFDFLECKGNRNINIVTILKFGLNQISTKLNVNFSQMTAQFTDL